VIGDAMDRRGFLARSLAAGVSLMGCVPGEPAPRGERFRVWAWVHGNARGSGEEWRSAFARLGDAGFTGVLVSGGDLDVLSPAAREAGLEFHRWIWALNRNGDAWAQREHPEWFTVSRDGRSSLDHPPYVGYYKWVCPSRRPVREYLVSLAAEVAADERVDGVHLDYIRHCDVILPRGLWERYDLVQDTELPEFDFCYCEVCRAAFLEQTGRDPALLADPAADEDWRRFRWDSVTGLVVEVADAVRARGKSITAAVFPSPSIARRLVRQAWDEWPLDAVFPMLYHGFYLEGLDWIGDGVREARSAGVGPGAGQVPGDPPPDRINAGLYLPDLSPGDAAEAVVIARDAGAGGVSFFEMDGLTDEHLRAIGGVIQRG
jgi:hypothetical protein